MSRLPFHVARLGWNSSALTSEGLNCARLLFKLINKKIGPLSHLKGKLVFPGNNGREAFTVMHSPVLEHSDTFYLIFRLDL